jgi:ribosomal protein L37AE/L43A
LDAPLLHSFSFGDKEMASCSHCGSNNYRVQETGAFVNAYYCINCKKSFDKLSPTVKWKIATTVISVIAVIIGVELPKE